MCRATGNAGLIALAIKKLPQALERFNHQQNIATQLGFTFQEIRARGNRGTVLFHMGDYKGAIAEFESILQYSERQTSPEVITCRYASLSRCYAESGQLERGRSMAKDAYNYAEQIGIPAAQIVARRCLAEFDQVLSVQLLSEALEMSRQKQRRFDEVACMVGLSALENEDNAWHSALSLAEKIGMQAWLEGHSPVNAPKIPFLI